jgi:hypothetical protein
LATLVEDAVAVRQVIAAALSSVVKKPSGPLYCRFEMRRRRRLLIHHDLMTPTAGQLNREHPSGSLSCLSASVERSANRSTEIASEEKISRVLTATVIAAPSDLGGRIGDLVLSFSCSFSWLP